MADPPPPRLFAFVIAASILVALIGWRELHRDRDEPPGDEAGEATDEPGTIPAPIASPGPRSTGADRPAGDGAAVPRSLPTLVGEDGQPVADPALVPGRPGIGAPAGHGEVDAEADEDWLDRNRNPSEFPPPPLIPPDVADREPGQPPTPQGAGARAHELWSGEPDSVDEPVDPAAARAELQAAMQRELVALSRCFQTGQVPPLAVTVQQIRRSDGDLGGYVAMIDQADGSELAESVEECLMEVLEELQLAAPPGASSVVVYTGTGGP